MTSPVISPISGLDHDTATSGSADSAERRRVEPGHAVRDTGNDTFVGAAAKASMTLLGTQLAASFVVANFNSAQFNVSRWLVFPYLTIVTNSQTFGKVLTWSSLAAVTVSCFMALWVQHTRRDDRAAVYGWGTGIGMSALLVMFQFLRASPTGTSVGSLVLAQAAAIAAASAVLFVGLRSDEKPSDPSEPSSDIETEEELDSLTHSTGAPTSPPVQRSTNEA